MADNKYDIRISIPFPTNRLAKIAYDVLIVDAEPKRSSIKKELAVEQNILKVAFDGADVKNLRVAVTSFFTNIVLIAETMDFAGAPVSEEYSHYQG